MSALLNNLASIFQQLENQAKPKGKKPTAPTPLAGSPGYKPLARPRGTLLSNGAQDVPLRKTLLGS